MCGIAGGVALPLSLEDQKHVLAHACAALKHRGPDATGFFFDFPVILGATRLAIRDPSRANQPMTRDQMTLVFNGELYGIETLKHKLERAGHLFTTDSDTEIFLRAFLEYEEHFLDDISGMFAFALWDARQQKLYLGRDRFGEKPLYYYLHDDSLIFASEIKALFPWPFCPREIDETAIGTFIKNSYVPSPKTGFKHLYKLEPASILTWQNGSCRSRRYAPTTKQDKLDAPLLPLLEASVAACTVSDRPLGLFLSGGLDSTTIACFASKARGPLPAFSIVWSDEAYSERAFASKAAHYFNLPHTLVECTHRFFEDHFDKVADLYDEPFGDESMFPTFCLAQEAKKQVDVVLTGDGADELFHGYERYRFEGSDEAYLDLFSATPDPIFKTLFNREFPLERPPPIDDPKLRGFRDLHTYLPDDILTKVDRATMAVGLEARAPFLTPAIANHVLRHPSNRLGKTLLATLMAPYLPSAILQRKKMGFGMPLGNWFRSSLKGWLTQRLFSGRLQATGWFYQHGIEQLLEQHLSRKVDAARPLLNLVVLERWLSKFQK